MSNNEFEKLVSILSEPDPDFSDTGIPEFDKRAKELTQRVTNFISAKKEERELPWLAKVREGINQFNQISDNISATPSEAKKFIQEFLSKKNNMGRQAFAAQFFRGKTTETLSDEELISLYRDLKLLEKLDKDENKN